jgi:hypothetical protein
MHALQHYGDGKPGFDGNTYSYSSTYHASLQRYTHHVTAPTVPEARLKYHMTELRGLDMSRETFVQGATVFRNASDLAQTPHAQFTDADSPSLHKDSSSIHLNDTQAAFGSHVFSSHGSVDIGLHSNTQPIAVDPSQQPSVLTGPVCLSCLRTSATCNKGAMDTCSRCERVRARKHDRLTAGRPLCLRLLFSSQPVFSKCKLLPILYLIHS